MLLDIGEFSSFQCCYASIALWFKLFLFYFKYVILTYLLILSFHFVSYFICSYSSYIPSQLTLETPPPPPPSYMAISLWQDFSSNIINIITVRYWINTKITSYGKVTHVFFINNTFVNNIWLRFNWK